MQEQVEVGKEKVCLGRSIWYETVHRDFMAPEWEGWETENKQEDLLAEPKGLTVDIKEWYSRKQQESYN